MAVTAPARSRRTPEFDDPERLEALIKEARRRARIRRLRYATFGVLVASAGAAAVLGPGGGGGAGGPAAPEPAPAAAPSEIKLTGARLAYVPEWENGALYVTEPDGSGARPLAKCDVWIALCVIRDPAWSPDRGRIAFLRGPWGAENENATDLALYVIGLNGRGERRLAKCGGDCGTGPGPPKWSPDGSQIAFTRRGALSIVDVASGHVRRLTTCPQTHCNDIGPAWSPDQTAIAFTRSTENAPALYLVSVGSGQTSRLAAEGMSPTWAPDGRTILVQTRRGIERVAADGSGMTLIAPGSPPATLVGNPSWSPDGSRVLYFSFRREKRGYRAEVWSMKPNGSAKERLYRQACCLGFFLFSFKPLWSADGSRLAFSVYGPRYERNAGGTFVVNADGTRLRNLTRQRTDFAWQPTPASTKETRR